MGINFAIEPDMDAIIAETEPRLRSFAANVTIDLTAHVRRLGSLATEFLCAVRGHELLMAFESDRILLRCAKWDIEHTAGSSTGRASRSRVTDPGASPSGTSDWLGGYF